MEQLKKKRTEVRTDAVCRSCAGSGINNNFPINIAKKCKTCDGSGVVEIVKVIYTTIIPKPSKKN